VTMRLIIMDNADKVSEWAAKYVVKRIKDFNPGPGRYFVLGLPTGNNKLLLLVTIFTQHKYKYYPVPSFQKFFYQNKSTNFKTVYI